MQQASCRAFFRPYSKERSPAFIFLNNVSDSLSLFKNYGLKIQQMTFPLPFRPLVVHTIVL